MLLIGGGMSSRGGGGGGGAPEALCSKISSKGGTCPWYPPFKRLPPPKPRLDDFNRTGVLCRNTSRSCEYIVLFVHESNGASKESYDIPVHYKSVAMHASFRGRKGGVDLDKKELANVFQFVTEL